VVEVFAESIPMTVVQLKTLMVGKEFDWVLMVAILVSVTFVAEATTYITYVKDIGVLSRATGKLFYGFVPLGRVRRMVVKVGEPILLSV